ncbi:MAG: hypothetical protein IIU55_03040 [Paludibacteraceae bacterium]|nr:hypothetical protein [Paludibacteraceae bacterium]
MKSIIMKKGVLLFVLCCVTTLVSAQVVRNDTTYHTICAGESYEWENNNYNQHGCYDEIYTAVDGTDSVVTLNLTVLPEVLVTADTITLCYGDSCTWQGHVYAASGDYADTLQTLEFGCDSIVTLHLTVLPEVPVIADTITLCYGDSCTWQGRIYADSGDYVDTLQTLEFGCDSIVTLHLTILPQVLNVDTITLCYGDSCIWQGNVYKESTIDSLVLQDVNGCDSVMMLYLTVLPAVPVTTDIVTLCYGESYTWQGNVYTASGVDTVVLYDVNGCDSIVTLQLTILPEVAKTTESATICYGESYMWQGNAYAASGNYSWTLQDVNGCDSVVMLDLTVLPAVPVTNEIATICHGESYMWQGNVYMESVVDTVVLQDLNGCDSVVVLSLTVLPIAYTTEDVTIIDGETYMWHGAAYKMAGTYVDTLKKSDGCDSIVTLSLKVLGNDVVVHAIQPMELCADEGVIEMIIEWEGWVDSVALQFVRDTLDTIAIGLHDTIVPMPADGYLSIPYTYIRAGVYEANVIGSFCQNKVFEQMVTLKCLYPSSVLEQRWDDVICVLTSAYNGGYDFTAFQWYKNGEALEGENGYYLNQLLEEGAEYSVLLSQQDSIYLMSCPIVIGQVEEPEISVEPTLVTKKQPVRCHVAEAATLRVYDMMGNLLINKYLLDGECYLQMPQSTGIYMVNIVLQTNQEKNIKVMVL